MFLGRFEHTIDSKGRLIVPARFRDSLIEQGAFIIQGFDLNLIVLTPVSFEAVSKRINQMSLTDPTARLLRRLIFSTANHLQVDKVGRILLPLFLRNSAELDDKAIVIGMGEYFEIWSPGRWDEQEALLQDAETNAQRFISLELTSE